MGHRKGKEPSFNHQPDFTRVFLVTITRRARDWPWWPSGKTLHSQCRGPSSIPGWELISYATMKKPGSSEDPAAKTQCSQNK